MLCRILPAGERSKGCFCRKGTGFEMSEELSGEDRLRLEKALSHVEGYFELGMPEQALEVLQRVRHLVDRDPVASFIYGETLRVLERYEEALPALRWAIERRPGLIQAYLSLGWCAKRSGRLGEAIDALLKAAAQAPHDALVHYNLACYLSLAGRRDEALWHLREAIRLDGSFRDMARTEPDFDALRSDDEFESLLEEW